MGMERQILMIPYLLRRNPYPNTEILTPKDDKGRHMAGP